MRVSGGGVAYKTPPCEGRALSFPRGIHGRTVPPAAPPRGAAPARAAQAGKTRSNSQLNRDRNRLLHRE
ncbi:hypothetical protein DSM19430T_28960 [Desulfovibrio psychrotolerans]|uniref:Uncharacterized protein n=1 Tax=Desulfovibrio psychrotolerans TaxID=415242 RepID=A0A7J0BYG3_9BACT|nr:hypothetical protein DSM19430T_28960 [Desulfovibrio psychrotolerans]